MKDKLIEVLSIQSESLNQFRTFAYVIRQLKKMKIRYYTYNGCIYAIKGDANVYPCIVSHLDTVHSITDNLTVIELNGNLTGLNKNTMQQTGIGGDDKVGIFIALQCLETFDNIKAVFFRDEEIGCEGSYDSDIDFFSDCGFVLQCDRRGNNDFITDASGVQLSNKDFQKDIKNIIKHYGYRFNTGMMTDVMALKESGIVCSMANISCGYYNPHCKNEYVNIADVFNCLEMVKYIIYSLEGKKYECRYTRPVYTATYADVKDLRYDGYGDWNVKQLRECCECCSETAKLRYIPSYRMEVCQKCIDQYQLEEF